MSTRHDQELGSSINIWLG